jgi:DNA-binding transcriptional ArsR family regulator
MTYESTMVALADPTRRKLYARLRQRPHAVGELATHLRVSQPAVSQHLAVLKRARLVRGRREGRRVLYRADAAGLAALRDHVDRMWTEVLESYARSFEE